LQLASASETLHKFKKKLLGSLGFFTDY